MGSKRTAELAVRHKSGAGRQDQVWLRIAAFLSLKSRTTQRTYLGIIEEWCSFLNCKPGSVEAAARIIQADDLSAIAYRNWLEKRAGQAPRMKGSSSSSRAVTLKGRHSQRRDGLQSTLANATVRKKFAALRRIYRMLISADVGINSNPFDSDRVPPPPGASGQKRPTEMIDFALVKSIISAPDGATPKGLRDKAVLAALFGGGLRRSEAVSIRIGDVRWSSGGTMYLRLRATKGRKDADQALPKWAAREIERVLELRRREGAQAGDYLFVSYRGRGGTIATPQPLSDSGLYKLFKYYCRLAGAGDYVSPHSARATAITKLLADGIGHREVQEFSRHASVQMVEAYDKRRIGVDQNPAKDLDFE
ncbi:MAG: tyrosine-type recombinase/integrase [Deltaproteobacteria bacterium]|nr:tyrosine-type recombinase/integrase [Deltaproteobacteria bacterium]